MNLEITIREVADPMDFVASGAVQKIEYLRH